jgi:hypothetical protein
VLDQCRAVRATPSGEYYLTYLSRAFAYVDLVWIDTPLADSALLTELRNLVGLRDRTSRFSRVDAFLAYLSVEEQREHRDFPLLRGADWAGPFVSKIQSQIEREKRFIRGRLARYDHWGAVESHPSS